MIRAAKIDPVTGIVDNIMMVNQEDIDRDATLIAIPVITFEEVDLSFPLSVNMREHRWNGTEFVDQNGKKIELDPGYLQKVSDKKLLQQTEQTPPEVI